MLVKWIKNAHIRAYSASQIARHACVDLLTSGAVHIRFLHFILAHYVSAFKPGKDKKWH